MGPLELDAQYNDAGRVDSTSVYYVIPASETGSGRRQLQPNQRHYGYGAWTNCRPPQVPNSAGHT